MACVAPAPFFVYTRWCSVPSFGNAPAAVPASKTPLTITKIAPAPLLISNSGVIAWSLKLKIVLRLVVVELTHASIVKLFPKAANGPLPTLM